MVLSIAIHLVYFCSSISPKQAILMASYMTHNNQNVYNDVLHGHSKSSGRLDQFLQSFWNWACADNEIFALAQLHRAINHACTMPWLQQLAVSLIPTYQMICQKSHIIQWTIIFPITHLGKRKQCPMPSDLLGLASDRGSGNEFTSWLSAH